MASHLKPRDRVTCPRCLVSFLAHRRLCRCIKGCRFRDDGAKSELGAAANPRTESSISRSALIFEPRQDLSSGGLALPLGRSRVESVPACPACGTSPAIWVCPECLADLPTEGLGEPVVGLALLGPAGAGKSTYLAVAETELGKLGQRAGYLIDPIDQSTHSRFGSSYQDPVYRPATGSPAGVTPTPGYHLSPNNSLTWSFRIRGNAQADSSKGFTGWLSIFDTAGSDWETRRGELAAALPVLGRAAVPLLVIDPTRIATVREELKRRAGRFNTVPGLDERIERRPIHLVDEIRGLAALLEQAGHKSPYPGHVAVIFNKLDIWGQLAEPGTILAEIASDGAIDLPWTVSIEARVHEEIEALLVRWTGEAFLQHLELKLPRHRFFAISTLGIGAAEHPASAPHPVSPWITRPLAWSIEMQGLGSV